MGYTFDMLLSCHELASLRVNASEDTKVRACYSYLFLEGSQATVAKYFCISQSTLSRWIQTLFSSESTESTSANTRQLLSPAEVSFILSTVQEDPLLYLREIKARLFRFSGRVCSISTIHRSLVSSGFSRKRCRSMIRKAKVQLILNFEKKLSFSLGIIFTNQLVFIDEISFRKEHFSRLYGRSPRNIPVATENQLVNVDQISVVVAISQDGYLYHHIQEGHFSRLQSVAFLEDLINLGYLRTKTGSRSVLVVDGCNIHVSPFIHAALKKCGISYFILPPYCPESNPIEAFFGVLRRKVREISHHSIGQNSIDVLQAILPRLKCDCTRLFNHSGWKDFEYYKSPYLSGPLSEFLIDFVDN
ncbi:hypothetical protein GEMRC1_009913 [Eukaryota sp. GEM-RC1]